MNRRKTGKEYERLAASYLEGKGYCLLEENYYCPKGEVDLIFKDGPYYVFCEVKYRKDKSKGSGFEAMDIRKQRRISQSAMWYLMKRGIGLDCPCRFDVVVCEPGRIDHLPNAFELVI